MRLIRISFVLLILVLSAGIAFAQEAQPEPRLADTYVFGGDFDSYAKFVTYWTVINGAAKDTRVCGDLGYNGSNCAFQFKGHNPEKTRLTQVINPEFRYGTEDLHYGFFSARVKPIKGEINLRFAFTFTFKDGSPAVKTSYTYTGTGPALDYETIYFETESSFNPKTIKLAKVNIRNFSENFSTVYVDYITIGMNIVAPE